MKNAKLFKTVPILALTIALVACGETSDNNQPTPPTPTPTPTPTNADTVASMNQSATVNSLNDITTKTSDGTAINISNATGSSIGGTSFTSTATTGTALGEQSAGGLIIDPLATLPNADYLAFGVTTSAEGADAYTSMATSNRAIGNNTTLFAADVAPTTTVVLPIDYAYTVGTIGNTPMSTGSASGLMTLDPNGQTVQATLTGAGDRVVINGTYSGQTMSGSANLVSNSGSIQATGNMNGAAGYNGGGINIPSNYQVMGTFAGDNSSGNDDTAFAGAFTN